VLLKSTVYLYCIILFTVFQLFVCLLLVVNKLHH